MSASSCFWDNLAGIRSHLRLTVQVTVQIELEKVFDAPKGSSEDDQLRDEARCWGCGGCKIQIMSSQNESWHLFAGGKSFTLVQVPANDWATSHVIGPELTTEFESNFRKPTNSCLVAPSGDTRSQIAKIERDRPSVPT